MKKSFLSVTKLFVAVASISFASLLMAQPSLAELGSVDSSSDNLNQSTDPFSRNSGDFNMFDLIHRANFGTSVWNADQQNQQLDSAAAEFKAKQQQQFQSQQRQGQTTPGSTVTLPVLTLPLNK